MKPLDAGIHTIGSYRIVDQLGQGGMGVVYRARHVSSEQMVALKTVRVPAPRWLASIRREVQALTRIRHPGIVRILDHGVQDGRPWYAMDLLEGETLRQYCARVWSPYRRSSSSPPSPTERASVTEGLEADAPEASFAQRPRVYDSSLVGPPPAAAGELRPTLLVFHRLFSTLAFLHGEGLVNCDLKPENVLIVKGEPILIDFGLTAHDSRAGRELLDSQRGLIGTVPYMSPEQIRGEFVDARSDLYSAGCMLYELLTGEPPFSGAGVLVKHLDGMVEGPSKRVTGLPDALERIVLKLLEKKPNRRFAFADEVATDLAQVAEIGPQSAGIPPATYLYRPQFVGRQSLLTMLERFRDCALDGSGTFVLLGGESGAGKTRLAMESTRVPSSLRLRVITSEVSTVSVEARGAIALQPMHVVRPLLQAIADECQQGGADVTDRLLGPARGLLALYEPALAQLPATEVAAVPLLAPETIRKQLFESLADVLRSFALEIPILWVIDDIGWADELSLAFLMSLGADFFERTPIFVLATHRTEELNPLVEELSCRPHVQHHRVDRLETGDVRSMIADMLGLSTPDEALIQFVSRESEGNPFFVAEYLRAAVAAKVLYRNADHTWSFAARDALMHGALETIGLPKTLRELVEQRLASLSDVARQLTRAFAVLGRETETDTLRAVCDIPEEVMLAGVDELLRRDVLTQPEPETLRFVHDKLREVAYGEIDAALRGKLHGSAARVLQRTWQERAEAHQIWPALGHHFAAAQDPVSAAQYLRLAADHARQGHANVDAITLYREAIQQRELARAASSQSLSLELAAMSESLGDVLTLTGGRHEARTAYDAALGHVEREPSATRPRILRKLGKTWEMEHRHEEALNHYAGAQRELGDELPAEPGLRAEWLEVHIEQLWVYYWLARVADMDQLVARLDPMVRDFASPLQHVRFFQARVLANLRRQRFLADEETLRFARTALSNAREASARSELPMAQFLHAFTLLLSEATNADGELQIAEQLARRTGDAGLLTRCLTYLTMSARSLRDIDETEARAERCLAVARSAGLREYIAAALANQAWVRLRRGCFDEASALAREALELWASLTLVFPFQSLALIPLLETSLATGHLQQAVACAEALLSQKQRVLRGAATDALSRALRANLAADLSTAQRELLHAVRYLEPSN